MANVLVVEDDQFVRTALIREFTDRAHAVRSASTALDALREVSRAAPDVVVLDLGLPDLDGAEVLKMLRGVSDVPVIVATARDDVVEIVRLLNAGADDYLIKSFSGEHLGARLGAVLRRSRQAPERRLCEVGDYAIQAATSTEGQVRDALGVGSAWNRIAVTPMIGVNDTSTEVFTLTDAKKLAAFAKEKNLAWLSMWSATRDKPCPGGPKSTADATCSSIAQNELDFTRAFTG